MEEYYTKRCSEIEDPAELTEYMLQTAPYIQELLNLKEENVSDAKFPLAFKKNTKQKELFERFLVEVEGKYPDEIKTDRSFEICKRCDVALIDHSSASSLVCPKCGLTVDYLGEELSYKEEQEIEKNFCVFLQARKPFQRVDFAISGHRKHHHTHGNNRPIEIRIPKTANKETRGHNSPEGKKRSQKVKIK